MLAKLVELLGAAAGRRLRPALFGAAMTLLAAVLVVLFAALGIGFASLAAYTALSANGPVGAALIVSGVTAGLALATFAVWALRPRAPRNTAPPTVAPADPLIAALLATGGAQEQLLRALKQAAPDLSPTRLVALALICGVALGGRLGKRPIHKT